MKDEFEVIVVFGRHREGNAIPQIDRWRSEAKGLIIERAGEMVRSWRKGWIGYWLGVLPFEVVAAVLNPEDPISAERALRDAQSRGQFNGLGSTDDLEPLTSWARDRFGVEPARLLEGLDLPQISSIAGRIAEHMEDQGLAPQAHWRVCATWRFTTRDLRQCDEVRALVKRLYGDAAMATSRSYILGRKHGVI
jgi:hypothetical protein